VLVVKAVGLAVAGGELALVVIGEVSKRGTPYALTPVNAYCVPLFSLTPGNAYGVPLLSSPHPMGSPEMEEAVKIKSLTASLMVRKGPNVNQPFHRTLLRYAGELFIGKKTPSCQA
jgi:hypothetical protein